MEYHIEHIDKDFDLVLTEYKKIPLTQEKIALVDTDDYEWLDSMKWHLNDGYALTSSFVNGKVKRYRMHRLIMAATKEQQIDHINGDRHDNRRNNLRYCNSSQNHMNVKIRIINKSGYKGVSWSKSHKKWHTCIKLNRKVLFLGRFKDKIIAAQVYNKAAIKYFGKFARLNEI